MLIAFIPSDYPTHPYYNMPIQGNPLSTRHLYDQSNFNQNYALMAQQQMAAMHAAIQGNSHQISRGFPINFFATKFNHMRASSFNGGKLPFNYAPIVAAAYNQIKRPQQSFAGPEGPQRFSSSKGNNLSNNKGLFKDEVIKHEKRQIQGQEKPKTDN